MSEHKFTKQNLVTRPDMTDLYACEHCKLKYVRRGLSWNPPAGPCPKSPTTPGTVRVKEDTVAKTETKKTDKSKKMTQAERDAIFGKDDETVVVTPKKGSKPEAKKETKPAPKAEKSEAKKPETKKVVKPTKPVKKSAKEDEAEEHARRVASDNRKLKSTGECKRRATSVYGMLFEAFKGGARVGDVIEELKMTYSAPRSKRYRGNERAYFMGTISILVADGLLVEA